jgi:hypothetical protein
MRSRNLLLLSLGGILISVADAQLPDLLETTPRRPAPTQVDVDRAQIELTRIEAARREDEINARRAAQTEEYARQQRKAAMMYQALQAEVAAGEKAKSDYAKHYPSTEFQKQLEAQKQFEAKQRDQKHQEQQRARSAAPSPGASVVPTLLGVEERQESAGRAQSSPSATP